MELSFGYSWVKFPPSTIRQAMSTLQALVPEEDRADGTPSRMTVALESESWEHDSLEEFFADYDHCRRASLSFQAARSPKSYRLTLSFRLAMTVRQNRVVDEPNVSIWIEAPTRGEIETVRGVFRDAADASTVAEPKFADVDAEHVKAVDVTIFIGHGHDPAWRELSDCLEKQHDLVTDAFEFGANAGHTTRSILERLTESSSLALLVMTAEDEDASGRLHARDNVIHETGLFQGALGFDRAIVLLEDGCEEFSNIQGVQQIRFAGGQIRGVVGDVLAIVRREFGR